MNCQRMSLNQEAPAADPSAGDPADLGAGAAGEDISAGGTVASGSLMEDQAAAVLDPGLAEQEDVDDDQQEERDGQPYGDQEEGPLQAPARLVLPANALAAEDGAKPTAMRLEQDGDNERQGQDDQGDIKEGC